MAAVLEDIDPEGLFAAAAEFGPGFIWGVSTSSYQIEGATEADGRGPSIWDTHCRLKGRIANGDTGEIACDHYRRYPEDIALMRRIGVGAYRFSVSWPRVLPRGRGRVNQAGIGFYDRLVDELLANGIEPWLCLYHWDLPQSLDDLGGWTNRDCAGWFADYATLLARRLGDRVRRWATMNEPSVFVLFGYGFGWNAPAIADRAACYAAMHHVNLAHGAAVQVLRDHVPGASIGVIHNRQPCRPETVSAAADQAAADLLDVHWNRAFADPQILGAYPPELSDAVEPCVKPGDMARICRTIDWLGLNHYSPIYARAEAGAPLGFAWGHAPNSLPSTDVGWVIHPDAFRDELLRCHERYGLPLHVLENGFGGHDAPDASGRIADGRRIRYLAAYIAAMQEARRAGADVRGYFVWSLLDNFEWGSGYADRFGLVHVDYATQKRTPKASADWYGRLIAAARHPAS